MKLLHIFKVILLLLLPCFVLAQYPNNPVKSRLGWQTTGDGLVYRGSGAPAYSPGTMFNAWMYLDTVSMALYGYKNFQWVRVPNVNNGLSISSDGYRFQLGGSLIQNTTVSTSTYDLLFGRTSGTNYAWMNVYGSGQYAGLFNSFDNGNIEAEITAGGGTASLLVENVAGGGNSSIYVNKDGFQANYLHPTLGASFFKMDSTKFRIRGLVAYATHAAADAANTDYQMYTITDGRAIYVKSGNSNKVSPNISDNNTVVSILNSKPFSLGQWTTAGRPTGVQGYLGYNTTTNGLDWYNGTRWATGLESTFARGTAGSVFFADANGQVTQDNTNFFYNSTAYSIRLGASGTVDKAEIGSTDGSGNPYIRLFNAGIGDGYIKLITAVPSAVFSLNFGLSVSGAITTTSNFRAVGLASNGTDRTGNGAIGGELILRPNVNNPAFINFTENGAAYWGNLGVDNTNGDFKYETTPSGEANWETGTTRFVIKQNGRVGIGASTTVNYSLEQTGQTDGFGVARGTVAQRPTIVSSTTPIRFNTDSTALEYGESVGTWRQLATRAYARSLVTGLGTGTVTSVGLSLPSIFSVSGSPVTTSGTLSASFTGGSSSQFLRGDGTWSNKIVKEAGDSVIFNKPGVFGGNGAFVVYGDDGAGYQSYHERADYGYTYNYIYTNGFNDESRSYLGSARGTRLSPSSLQKGDRIGGVYFHAYGNSQFNKTAVIRAEVDSIYSGDKPMAKIIFGVDENNDAETSANWRFIIKNDRNVSVSDHVVGTNLGIGLSSIETVSIDARLHVKGTGTTTGKTLLLEDSGGADILTITDNKTIQAHGYATPATTAAALGKTQSNYAAGFATDGTVTSLEVKRDTTIFVTADTDYDFSAAVTTAQIGSRYNRVIIHMTLTSGASADKTTTLHTPDANLMQCEFVIRGTDNNGSHTNDISFGTNNAISSDGTNASGYTLSAGQGLHVRVVYNGSAYKYIYY